MDLFDLLEMIGGLCLFLFGMSLMGQALERRAGSGLRTLLRKLTTNRLTGFLTGLVVTAVIQSSSATTVMVVGFVNSGLMILSQAFNVIMGANVGTTVTAWILSLGAIDSGNVFVQLLKPSSFTPVLAFIGIIFYMFCKNDKKKDTGVILLGFATLMFGMEAMSGAVKGLKDVPEFQQLFLLFRNPILGVLAGAVLTAAIQSSSASVGILQALSATGQVTLGAAIPIIMGQNIGTCVTALISSVGTNKNARRAGILHLLFNVIGTLVCLALFMLTDALFAPAIFNDAANQFNIAVSHTLFNTTCTIILLPMGKFLEKLTVRLIPDDKKPELVEELDERLLATPTIALERCRMLCADMANAAVNALEKGMTCLNNYSAELAQSVRDLENMTDHYEDILGSYLVKLSVQAVNEDDSVEAAGLLKVIGDFERITDHAVNLVESAEELIGKEMSFSENAKSELSVICAAVSEVVRNARDAFITNDLAIADKVEPLEEVVDDLKDTLRSRHIHRLQKGLCSIEVGFVWADLLTDLERISDHSSNIAVCILDMANHNMNQHEAVRLMHKDTDNFDQAYKMYSNKYRLNAE